MASDLQRRNKWTFSIGTVGRDMVYTLVSMYFILFLTKAVGVSDAILATVSSLILGARLFDVFMDIVMGSIVDNTRTRWGSYKPWIFGGMIASAIVTVLLFTHLSNRDVWTIVLFALFYLLWSLSWTSNDVPYWSLMPTLSLDQKKREQIGSLSKIFATIGQFAVVGTVIPLTTSLGQATGSATRGWLVYVLVIVIIMVAGQTVTLVGTKVPQLTAPQEKATIRQLFNAIVKNDQLLWVAIAMVTFQTGFVITTSFGVYFFQFAYGNDQMYTVFGIIMGVSMIAGYLVFPVVRSRLDRRSLYTLATGLIVLGYLIFFLVPSNNIFLLGIAGLLLFVGNAFVTILILVFIADTIDYGHWKLGRRNTAITFALQPFINKVAAALAQQVVALTLIWSGINKALEDAARASTPGHTINAGPADVSPGGIALMKAMMLLVPLVLTVIGYLLYRWKYKIDETFYAKVQADLAERGQVADNGVADNVPADKETR